MKDKAIDQLKRMAIFHAVAQHGSFSAAARALGLAKSAVSTQVRRLEAELGVELLLRSTRRLALTEAGTELFGAARRIVEEAATARARIGAMRDRPVGTLRVGTSIGFGMFHLVPALASFQKQCPELRYDLVLEDRVLDLIEDRLDLVIGFGTQRDSRYVVQTLAKMGWAVCASPSYLEAHGTPETPAELAAHDWLQFGDNAPTTWTFTRAGRRKSVRVRSAFRCNNLLGVHAALRAGMGIAGVSRGDFSADLEAGEIVSVLDEWSLPPVPVVALKTPGSRDLPKVRLAVEFLAHHWARLS